MNPIIVKVGGAAGVDSAAVCVDVAALTARGLSRHPGARYVGRGRCAGRLDRAGVPVRHLVCRRATSAVIPTRLCWVYVAAVAGQVNKTLLPYRAKAGLQRSRPIGCGWEAAAGVAQGCLACG